MAPKTLGRKTETTKVHLEDYPSHVLTFRYVAARDQIEGSCSCGDFDVAANVGVTEKLLTMNHELHAKRARRP